MITSNFDDNSIKNECASMETPFSHYKSMGNFLDANFVAIRQSLAILQAHLFFSSGELKTSIVLFEKSELTGAMGKR